MSMAYNEFKGTEPQYSEATVTGDFTSRLRLRLYLETGSSELIYVED